MLAGDSRFFEESVNAGRLRALLAGRSQEGATGIQERTQAMKWLLAMLSKGRDVSSFFPDVVKNVSVRNSIELKKLVYVFLMHYADHDEACRDLALLSVNSFQKDLADRNPLIRGLALRTMTSIRVADIVQLQILAVQRCSVDGSTSVRRTAAQALPKIYSLDRGVAGELIEILIKLLGDPSQQVLGSALAAYQEICPERYDLLHPRFRKYCMLLPDLDEWGQIMMISILMRYARKFFVRPSIITDVEGGSSNTPNGSLAMSMDDEAPRKLPDAKDLKSFYAEDEDHEGEENGNKLVVKEVEHQQEDKVSIQDQPLEPDHRLLLKSCLPLLRSRNAGVIHAVVSMMWHCGKRSNSAMQKVSSSLVYMLRDNREVHYVALQSIVPIAGELPQFFRPHLASFFVNCASDASFVRVLKIDILTLLVDRSNVETILREFEVYFSHPEKSFVTYVTMALGKLVNAIPKLADKCLRGLLTLMTSKSECVVSEAVVVTRTILQQHPNHPKMVRRLVGMLANDKLQSPAARASMLWISTEFIQFVPDLAPEILRKMALSFSQEEQSVKAQILNLAVRLRLVFQKPAEFQIDQRLSVEDIEKVQNVTGKLLNYVLELGRFDTEYALRDKVRVLDGLLKNEEFDSAIVLLSKKPAPSMQKVGCGIVVDPTGRYSLESLSHLVGHSAPGYQQLLDWPTETPDSSVREPVPDSERSGPFVQEMRSQIVADEHDFYAEEGEDESVSEVESDGDEEGFSPSDEESSEVSDFTSSGDDEESSGDSESDDGNKKHASKQDDILTLFDTPSAGVAFSTDENSLQDFSLQTGLRMLLHSIHGDGLEVQVKFERQRSSYSYSMNFMSLRMSNRRSTSLERIRIAQMRLQGDQQLVPFQEISILAPGANVFAHIHADFAGASKQPIIFSFQTDRGLFPVRLYAPCGELVTPAPDLVELEAFEQERVRLSGMHETNGKLRVEDFDGWLEHFPVVANLAFAISTNGGLRAAGRKLADLDCVVIIVVSASDKKLSVASDDFLFAANLCEELLASSAMNVNDRK